VIHPVLAFPEASNAAPATRRQNPTMGPANDQLASGSALISALIRN
jgi:hypothetical protein